MTSSSSDSDYDACGGGDLEADADSLACRQGLSSSDQSKSDNLKLVCEYYLHINFFSYELSLLLWHNQQLYKYGILLAYDISCISSVQSNCALPNVKV